MADDALKYALRSIVRMLNGDREEAAVLARKAELLDNRNGYFKIGQVIPGETKERLYRLMG